VNDPRTEFLFVKPEKGGALTVDQGFKRKLAATLSADVEGYSRLMGEGEEATVRTRRDLHLQDGF
jgi:hypothetical protein